MNEKLISTAKTADTVAKVVGNVLQVFAIIFVVFAVLLVVLGERMFETGSLTLDLDFIKLHLSDDQQAVTDAMKLYTAVGLVSASVAFVIISLCCKQLRRILVPMTEGRPFDAAVPGELRKAAWAVLIGGAVMQLLGMVERLLATMAYPLNAVFSSDAIQDWEVVFTMDGTFVLLFFVLMLLSYVFSYGVRLQQESDETL